MLAMAGGSLPATGGSAGNRLQKVRLAMLVTTVLKAIAGGALLGSLFWRSSRGCAALLLLAWTIAIGVFAYLNLPERFLWIPVLLATAGVLSPVFVLAIPAQITMAASTATFILFIGSLEVLSTKRWSSALGRNRAR
jgi:hypothetical protein